MKRISVNPYRLVIQIVFWGVLIFLGMKYLFYQNYTPDFEAYCPFGGVQAILSYISNDSLACAMTSAQIAMGVILFLVIILFSKLFCSFICPIGSFSEWLGKLGEKLKIRYTITGITDKILRSLKYILLFITLYFTINSSELFCKNFDPYYAVVSGYNADVSVIWATVAIALVIFGSFYIRLFWCKYLCPLGALSNIFRFFLLFLSVSFFYVLFLIIGFKINIIWPIAILCILTYTFEVFLPQIRVFPVFKITRNAETCTKCKLCSITCPQAIDVKSMNIVKHTDCHLCADCIHVCPEKGTLAINKNGRKWLPALVLIVLICIGLYAGRSFELPTINEYWGKPDLKKGMMTYTRSGLKNITCYGSSTAFANQMRKVNGVTGVTTYVGTNTVSILYDPEKTDTIAIQKSFFTPVKVFVRDVPDSIQNLMVFNLLVDNFFDPLDSDYLSHLFSKYNNLFGFQTEFDCPIRIRVFADANSEMSCDSLKNIIEQEVIKIKNPDNTVQTIELNYIVKFIEKQELPVNRTDFEKELK